MGEGVGELSGAAGGDEFRVDVGEVQGGVLVGGGAEAGMVVVPRRLPVGSSGLDRHRFYFSKSFTKTFRMEEGTFENRNRPSRDSRFFAIEPRNEGLPGSYRESTGRFIAVI